MNAASHPQLLVRVSLLQEGRAPVHREVHAVDGVVTVGRDPRSTVPLSTALASRHHAEIDVRGAQMQVRDVSMNGTIVGGSVIRRTTASVPFGTAVVIGPVTLTLQRGVPKERPPGRLLRLAQLTAVMSEAPRADAAPVDPGLVPPPRGAADLGDPGESLGGSGPRPVAAPVPARDGESTSEDPWASENALRAEIHKRLLEHLDLGAVDAGGASDPTLRPKVLAALREIVRVLGERIPAAIDRDVLIGSLADEAVGLGPVERFLSDPNVSEIMVVDPRTIYVEVGGKLVRADARFTNDDRVRATIERIVTPLGRRIDESVPIVDARLADGSRVNAVIRPLALRGAAITIRKFTRKPLDFDRLVGLGAMTDRMALFLKRSVLAKKNIVIAGGTGSGKTTLLNALSAAIPSNERIVTIEDAAELQLKQPHVVSLETRPSNMEGKGEYTIRDLVKNALRMRPDRIVVGECRGGEALDMLQAMNTGHDGSLTTTHANSPREAMARLETLVLMSGLDLPVRAIREQIAGSVQLVVQQARLSDGSRRVTSIAEVVGVGEEGDVELVPIFEFVRTGTGSDGKVIGEHRATGFLPSFLNDFLVMGLIDEGEVYL